MPKLYIFIGMREEIINKLSGYRYWLSDDIGMGFKKEINRILSKFTKETDVNYKYQVPLKMLYDMGIGDIKKQDDLYILDKLKKSRLVYDDDGNWLPINKLNTNYYALSELIVSVLEKTNKLEGFYNFINKKTDEEIKDFLKKHNKFFFNRVIEDYKIVPDFDSVLGSIKITSEKGAKSEKYVGSVLERAGFTTKYQGGDGDLIDMIFGIDLFSEKKGKMYLIQIKTNPKHIDIKDPKYKYITLFANPTKDGGVRIVERSGKEHFLDKNGKLINV